MCRVYFHQVTMGKSNQKSGKIKNTLVFEKVTQLSFEKVTLVTSGKLLIAFSTKVNLLYLLYSTTSASDKAKVFDKKIF